MKNDIKRNNDFNKYLFGFVGGINIIMCWYMRKAMTRFYVASEEASEIFSRLDAFGEHLKRVYEMPTFYGDENLTEFIRA